MDPKNCVKHFRETKSQINWTLEMKIGKKKKRFFFAKESETLKTERLSPDVWFPKILNSNYHWDDNGGEKIYITYQKPIYKFNLIFSQSNFTFHPPSTPKPHWSNHGGSNAWCHDVDMAPKRLPPGGPRKIRFFPPCPSNSATQSSFLSFREVLGSVLASWVCSNAPGDEDLFTLLHLHDRKVNPHLEKDGLILGGQTQATEVRIIKVSKHTRNVVDFFCCSKSCSEVVEAGSFLSSSWRDAGGWVRIHLVEFVDDPMQVFFLAKKCRCFSLGPPKKNF